MPLIFTFFDLQIKYLTQSVGSDHCRLKGGLQVDQILNRIKKIHKKCIERNKTAYGHTALQNTMRSNPKDHHAANRFHKCLEPFLCITDT